MPLTLAEARTILEDLGARGVLTELERRAVVVVQRFADRGRSHSATHTTAVAALIDARDHQREAIEIQRQSLEALDRAIGSATTATEMPAQ